MKRILGITLVMILLVLPVYNAQSARNTGGSAKEQILMPEGSINKVKILDDGSIKVKYNLVDESNLLMSTNKYSPEVRLYEGNTLVKAKEATVGEDQIVKFGNLQRDVEYTVVLSGPYDALGIGTPSNTSPYELDSQKITVPSDKATPTANIHLTTDENPTVLNEESMNINYDIVDEDLALLNEGTVGPRIIVQDTADDSVVYIGIPNVDTNQIENVTGLVQNHTYRVTITGQYDINYNGTVDNESPYVLDSEEFTLETQVPDGYIGVGTCRDLESIGEGENYPGASHEEAWELDGSYALTNNIDCSATNPANENYDPIYGEDGFEPIGGDYDNPFTGNFDGQNYKIDSLYVREEYDAGLFEVTRHSTLKNIILTNVSSTAKDRAGGLAGLASGASIENCYVSGSVLGEEYVGGLVGDVRGGVINNSYAEIVSEGTNYVGGLAGYINGGVVTDSFATGDVQGIENVGGLVGELHNEAAVENTYAKANVQGETNVGGLVGNEHISTIKSCYAFGNTEGVENVGGLAGEAYAGPISDSYTFGNVKGETNVGGLVGKNNGSIRNSYATTTVLGYENVGGLTGSNTYYIYRSYATGNVEASGSYVGGLIGFNSSYGDIMYSYAIGDIKGEDYVGGLIGFNTTRGMIENSYATGDVTGSSEARVGGLVGVNEVLTHAVVTNSYGYENQVVSGSKINSVGDIVTLDQLLDPNWYTNTLGFDSNWNIDPVSEGYYPHIMKENSSEEVANQENVAIV